VFRFLLPDRNLRAAGGKEVVLQERLHEVFAAGINAVMVGNYLTTLGTSPEFWRAAAAKHGLVLRGEVEQVEQAASGGCGTAKGCGSHG
jgi:biotin synthase-like enzyme